MIKKCLDCGKSISSVSKRCLPCYWESMKGNTYNYKEKIIIICIECSKKRKVHFCEKDIAKFCSQKCFHKYLGRKNSGENNKSWKGEKVGYTALHIWIRKRLAKPFGCNHCGQIKQLDLANKSGKYLRELDDWLWLCKSCHRKYDYKNHIVLPERYVKRNY